MVSILGVFHSIKEGLELRMYIEVIGGVGVFGFEVAPPIISLAAFVLSSDAMDWGDH